MVSASAAIALGGVAYGLVLLAYHDPHGSTYIGAAPYLASFAVGMRLALRQVVRERASSEAPDARET